MSDTPSSLAAKEEASAAEQTPKDNIAVSIHPDDAKDKVFTAILKALSKLGNKPSSPKELANVIIKYKYATLGGATPFATVSSRISQHFKRAAEHKPPRPPLLARHFDENHSRKINYSLATKPTTTVPQQLPSSPPHSSHAAAADVTLSLASASCSGQQPSRQNRRVARRFPKHQDTFDNPSDASHASSGDERMLATVPTKRQPPRASSQSHQTRRLAHASRRSDAPVTTRQTTSITTTTRLPRRRMRGSHRVVEEHADADKKYAHLRIDADADDESEEDGPSQRASKRTRSHRMHHSSHPTRLPLSPVTASSSSSLASLPCSPPSSSTPRSSQKESEYMPPPYGAPVFMEPSDNESEVDYSDYHEEMMKGDEAMADIELNTTNRDHCCSFTNATSTKGLSTPGAVDMQRSVSTQAASTEASSPRLNSFRSTSLSLQQQSPNLLGEDLWPPCNGFDQDFDTVFLSEDAVEHRIPFNIASPESVSVAELETYFNDTPPLSSDHASSQNDISSPPMSTSARTSRRRFSVMVESKETSQLKKVLQTITPGDGTRDPAPLSESSQASLEPEVETDEMHPRWRRKSWPEDGASSGALIDPHDTPEKVVEASTEASTQTLESPGMETIETKMPGSHNEATHKSPMDEVDVTRKQPMPSLTVTVDSLDVTDDAEVFVRFEDDDDKKMPTTQTPTKENTASVSQQDQAAADLLKAMNIDLATFQHIAAAIPGLSNKLSPLDLIKALTAFLQPKTSSTPSPSPSPSPSTSSNSVPPHLVADFQATLARFPALKMLLQKDGTPTLPASSASPLATTVAHVNIDAQHQEIVYTTTPTTPPMYITVVDNIAVCVAVLAQTDTGTECRIMRRLDSGYVNGTMLLAAGGIDTESERSMILSFEMERIRMPKKKSQLCGTWIPLHRARELTVTCSIQHRLGPFLSDTIENYFPSPLPISVPVTRRPPNDGRLAAMALATLCHTNQLKYPVPSLMARPVSPPARTTSAAQLHQLPSTGHRSQWGDHALKAPLLGTFDDSDEDSPRRITVIDSRSAASHRGAKHGEIKRVSTDDGSDVDIVNAVSDEEEKDTDTDTDVEEVRQRMKKMRDAAIDAMERGSSFDLDELLRNASHPIMEQPKQPPATPYSRFHRHGHGTRRRPLGVGKLSGGKIAPAALKKSASWSGSLTSPVKIALPSKKSLGQPSLSRKFGHTLATRSKTRGSTSDATITDTSTNLVVEHAATLTFPSTKPSHTIQTLPTPLSPPASTVSVTPTKVLATIQEDDEDEEIDIGGSDRDDDLR